jgi:hypothetical protein
MTDAPSPESKSLTPPRAFAQGTGLLLQFVGFTLFLSSCCICASTGLWEPVADTGEITEALRTQDHVVVSFSTMFDNPKLLGYTLTAFFSTVGGLALASFGLGMQTDRKWAAAGASVSSVTLVLILLAAGVALWLGEGGWVYRGWHFVLLIVMLLAAAFSIAAWREVRRQPPPSDIDIVKPGVKIPYNFYHDDPPDVRLAKELANRRAQLEAEQADLERMEQALKQRQDDA